MISGFNSTINDRCERLSLKVKPTDGPSDQTKSGLGQLRSGAALRLDLNDESKRGAFVSVWLYTDRPHAASIIHEMS